ERNGLAGRKSLQRESPFRKIARPRRGAVVVILQRRDVSLAVGRNQTVLRVQHFRHRIVQVQSVIEKALLTRMISHSDTPAAQSFWRQQKSSAHNGRSRARAKKEKVAPGPSPQFARGHF